MLHAHRGFHHFQNRVRDALEIERLVQDGTDLVEQFQFLDFGLRGGHGGLPYRLLLKRFLHEGGGALGVETALDLRGKFLHDLAHVLRTGSSGRGLDFGDERLDFVFGHLGGHVLAVERDDGLFGGNLVREATLLEDLDGFLLLLHTAGKHVDTHLVGDALGNLRGSGAGLHGLVLDIGMEGTERSERFGIVRLHGGLDVVENLCQQCTAHVLPRADCAPHLASWFNL